MKGWRYESARHALAARGVRTRYAAIKWRRPRKGEVVEWWTPEEFVKQTHGTKIENVPITSPHYYDIEKGWRPTEEMPERLEKAESVELLESIHPPEAFLRCEDGVDMYDGNKCINQGRHRAFAAWALGEKKVPVVVARRSPEADKKEDAK